MAANFEIYGQQPPAYDGTLTATVMDPGLAPTNVVDHAQAFTIRVRWDLTGNFLGSLGGTFQVNAFLDSFSGNPDVTQTQNNVLPIPNGAAESGPYTIDLTFAANTVAIGPYKLLVTVTHSPTNPFGTPDDLAGFVEGPIIQVY